LTVRLDTHVVLWLYTSGANGFPDDARARLGGETLGFSPAVELEITFLHEIGRVAATARQIVEELGRTIGLAVSPAAFHEVVSAARDLSWTRDPFDRLICADAVVSGTTLLTKDRTIRAHFADAHWD